MGEHGYRDLYSSWKEKNAIHEEFFFTLIFFRVLKFPATFPSIVFSWQPENFQEWDIGLFSSSLSILAVITVWRIVKFAQELQERLDLPLKKHMYHDCKYCRESFCTFWPLKEGVLSKWGNRRVKNELTKHVIQLYDVDHSNSPSCPWCHMLEMHPFSSWVQVLEAGDLGFIPRFATNFPALDKLLLISLHWFPHL